MLLVYRDGVQESGRFAAVAEQDPDGTVADVLAGDEGVDAGGPDRLDQRGDGSWRDRVSLSGMGSLWGVAVATEFPGRSADAAAARAVDPLGIGLPLFAIPDFRWTGISVGRVGPHAASEIEWLVLGRVVREEVASPAPEPEWYDWPRRVQAVVSARCPT